MRVVLRNPKRELDLPAPGNVGRLLRDLEIVPESVIVIRNDTLATHDERTRSATGLRKLSVTPSQTRHAGKERLERFRHENLRNRPSPSRPTATRLCQQRTAL